MLTQEDVKNVVTSVNYNVSGVETLLEHRQGIKDALENYQKELKNMEDRIGFLADTKVFYVKAIDLMYEESIGALKETLNTALQYIMFDKNYACNLTLEDKRGTKNLYLSLQDLDAGTEVDMKHGVGQGVRTIISFVLKTFYVINQNSHILFLDEKSSALSDQYVSRFFEFLKKFSEDSNHPFVLVLISHDTRFMDYADQTYLVSDGNIQKVENNGILEVKEEG